MIGFAGLSHLGIVSSAAAAAKGFQVVAYDPDPALCERLRGAQLPILEPGLEELVAANRSRLEFTADAMALGACRVIVFSVDTPTDADNQSDLSTLDRLIEQILPHAAPKSVLVILSQVPPGYTRQLALRLQAGDGRVVRPVFYQVETLIFGRAVERALRPERIIVGAADPPAELPPDYAALLARFECPVLRVSYESAEVAKISINMFLVSSISTANTLAELCEAIGADWSEIIPALKLDQRIGPHAYVHPGLGIAGGNLERDLVTVNRLAAEFGTDAGIVAAWLLNSRHRQQWVLKTVHAVVLSQRSNPVLAMWGLAYKANTISTKNSPALALLQSLCNCSWRAYDPEVKLMDHGLPSFAQVPSALDACRGAEALLIMTPWSEFATVDLAQVCDRMTGRIVIDPFGVLPQRSCAAAGLQHLRLGSPANALESTQ